MLHEHTIPKLPMACICRHACICIMVAERFKQYRESTIQTNNTMTTDKLLIGILSMRTRLRIAQESNSHP